jgi:hypothetical protein
VDYSIPGDFRVCGILLDLAAVSALPNEGLVMREDLPAEYLSRLPSAQRELLTRVNSPGLAALRGCLASFDAIAILGGAVSAPLYPMWSKLIGQLVDAAADRLSDAEAATCRVLTRDSPDEVVGILRESLGVVAYREVLRDVLRARNDPVSGRSWTALHELVCRCAFKGVITTSHDPGIADARLRVRPGAFATGFTVWDDEPGLERWRHERVFSDTVLPVLYAHGQHNRPDTVVLAATEYRRAYDGKLSQVLGRLMDGGHLVWIGFSFADHQIAAILAAVAQWSGNRAVPEAESHVAILPWDPDSEGNDPTVLARRVLGSYGARVVLYPAPGGDQSALSELLATLTDSRFPPATDLPPRASAGIGGVSPGEPTGGQAGDNTAFTPDERAEITIQLKAIRDSVRKTYKLTAEQIAAIDNRLDEAEEASKRLGRKDWKTVFYGIVFGLIVNDAIPPDVAQHIFTGVLHGLAHWLGTGVPPGPWMLGQ